MSKPKTYKREVAVTLAIVSHLGAGWLLWSLSQAGEWDLAVKIMSSTLTADMLFVLGAFGVDAVSKQFPFGAPRVMSQIENERGQ